MKQPNILFFFTDDQRFDTIAALGNPDIITPNLDRLSGRATVFTQAHIPVGTDPAVCMPSRAMLITGRSLFHIHDEGQSIPLEHVTMGEALRKAGYRTFGTGKWHNGAGSYARSFTDGAEIFFGGMTDHWNVPACDFDPTGKYDKREPVTPDPMNSNTTQARLADHIRPGYHSSRMVCDAAINFIRNRGKGDPFFAYISFLAPHDPRTMPEKFLKMYDPAKLTLPPNLLPEHPFDTGAIRIRDEKLASFPRTEEEIRRHLAEYYAMITHLDDELGRVLEALEKAGEMDNTIIVFAGDNGLAVGQHGLMGKQNCYEHSIRVPLMFAGPGIPEGRKSDASVYLHDIFPTLCELTGTPIPSTVDGHSLVPAFTTDTGIRDAMYFAYTDTQRAIKKDGWKLIAYAVGKQPARLQLFDLSKDPWEMNSLADDHAHQEKKESLLAELRRTAEEWDDTENKWGQRFWKKWYDSAKQDMRMAWWREAKFGIFIHWGLYAIPGGVYEGKEHKSYGEWLMHFARIPVEKYEKYAADFNPTDFNADAWVRLARDAGAGYIVFTTKHHDGFCLWDTESTDYNVVDATPFGRDVLAELAEACRKYDMPLGLYYSIMDWHHPDAQAPAFPDYNNKEFSNPNFGRYVNAYMRPQLRELLTRYGDIALLWFDGEWIADWNDEIGKSLYNELRELQPDILINNRIGSTRKGLEGFSESEFKGDFCTPEQQVPPEGLPGVDWETCMTMNDTWGYKKTDHNWKSAGTLIAKLEETAAKGGNFLLNVGPTPEGSIPEPSVERLQAIGAWMESSSLRRGDARQGGR